MSAQRGDFVSQPLVAVALTIAGAFTAAGIIFTRVGQAIDRAVTYR